MAHPLKMVKLETSDGNRTQDHDNTEMVERCTKEVMPTTTSAMDTLSLE